MVGMELLVWNFIGCYFLDELLVEIIFEVLEGEGWCLGYEIVLDFEESFCVIVRVLNYFVEFWLL